MTTNEKKPVIWLHPKNTRKGPVMTDRNGELEFPMATCLGCVHLGVHDWHYYYCSALPAQNQDPDYKDAYPWPGAGQHMFDGPIASRCPYNEKEEK